MTETVKTLCALTRAALDRKQADLIVTDGGGFFRIARENGLSGLVYPALKPECVDAKTYQSFHTDWLRYQAKDVAQSVAVEEFDQLCETARIDHLYLKGVILKSCYPETYMRSMGDIDVLFRPEDMAKVHAVLEADGYVNHENSQAHDIFMKDRDVVVEAHRSIDVESDMPRWNLFAAPWAHASIISSHVYGFEKTYFLMHLLRHLTKHLLSSGVGLRSILDIGLYLEMHKQDIDNEKLGDMLQQTELETFFGNVLVLNERLFGLDSLPAWRAKGDEEEAFVEELIDYVVASGIHGKAEGNNPQAVGMSKSTLEKGDVKTGRSRYLLRVAFPPRKLLMGHYLYLERHAWLLPWAWISRIGGMLFRKTKSTFRKIRNLKVTDDDISKRSELFRKLGL